MALLESMGSLLQNGVTLMAMGVVLIPYGLWLPVVLLASTLPARALDTDPAIRLYERAPRTARWSPVVPPERTDPSNPAIRGFAEAANT